MNLVFYALCACVWVLARQGAEVLDRRRNRG